MLPPLVRHIRKTLSALGYNSPRGPQDQGVTRGVKHLIIDGYATILAQTPTQFIAEFDIDQYSQALYSDWSIGGQRIKKQEHAVDVLAASTAVTPAWLLTTCYYSAFFATMELLRLTGRFVTNFSVQDASSITQFATLPVPGLALEGGNYLGIAQGDIHNNIVRIRYMKSSERPHALAWVEMSRTARAALSEVHHGLLETFCKIIGADISSDWPRLSDTRNIWNYRDAKLYGIAGRSQGKVFCGLAQRRESAYKWAQTRKLLATEENFAAAVGFARVALVDTVTEANRLVEV